MNWTQKYWDALEQLYWTPKYLGLKSIPQRFWEVDGDRVSIPSAMTNPDGPLYRRVTTGKAFSKRVRGHEETFNHIFELTFGILDGELTNSIFCDLLNQTIDDTLTSYGRELGPAFGFPKLYDISQPDGYFVGNNWTLGVELKFDAKTSIDQLAKYLLAFTVERIHNRNRKPISLIYISPNPDRLQEEDFCFSFEQIGPSLLDSIFDGARPSVQKHLRNLHTEAAEVLQDLSVQAFSWIQLNNSIERVSANVSKTGPEGRTVTRLLSGLSEEIRNHPLSGGTEQSLKGRPATYQ